MTIKKKFFFFILKLILILKLHFFYAILIILYSKRVHGTKKSKHKVLVFSKSGGIHDIESSIETGQIHKNIYEINRDIIKFTYRFFIDNLDGEQLENLDSVYKKKSIKYFNFLSGSFSYLKKIWCLRMVIGFNVFFRPEIEIQKACRDLGIKFICCHKEGVSSLNYNKIIDDITKKMEIKFYGDKILLYNQNIKNSLLNIKITDQKKMIVIGCSRADKQFKFKEKRKFNQEFKKLIFFIMPEFSILPSSKWMYIKNKKLTHENNKLISWNRYNLKTAKALIKIAKKFNNKIHITFKDKIGSHNKSVENLVNKSKLENLTYLNRGNSDYLIQDSDIVLASYSTTTFESVASGAYVLENKIGISKSSKILKYKLNYKNLFQTIKNYKDLEKNILKSFKKNNIKKDNSLKLKKLLKDYIGNNDGKSSIKLAKEIR